MTVLRFTNTGYYGNLKEYVKAIEEKLGKKINYDKEEEFYYYLIYGLDDLLAIIDIVCYECIIRKVEVGEHNEYVLEVYDDCRE